MGGAGAGNLKNLELSWLSFLFLESGARNYFHFLSFLPVNRDFSMGCGRRRGKFLLALIVGTQVKADTIC
jgi:hypothetical protein